MADNTTKLKEVLSEFTGMEYIDSEWREAIRKLESVIASMEAQEPVGQWTGSAMEWTFNPFKLKAGAKLYTHAQPIARRVPLQDISDTDPNWVDPPIFDRDYEPAQPSEPKAEPAEYPELRAIEKAEPARLTDAEILALEKLTPAMNDAADEWIYFARTIESKIRGDV
jgi:hypothetical protein